MGCQQPTAGAVGHAARRVPETARGGRSAAQMGHRSGCALAEVFRKPGTTMFWRLVYDLLPIG
eukprot:scaffold52504_cov72-Phaeocystis_antarctica.AAC.2